MKQNPAPRMLAVALALASASAAVHAQSAMPDTVQNQMQGMDQIPGLVQNTDPSPVTSDPTAQVPGTEPTLTSQQPADSLDRQLGDRPGQSATDARREGAIWASFALTDALVGTDVAVEVSEGIATLTGRVPTRAEMALAESIAGSVPGIGRVANQITVDPTAVTHTAATGQATGERDFAAVIKDASTTAAVKSKLLSSSDTDGPDVDVDTKLGHVTLDGITESEHSRQLAERIAAEIPGVQGVTNQLRVEADTTAVTSTDASVQTGFESSPSGINTSTPTIATTDSTTSDSAITNSIRSTLDSSTTVDAAGIGISAQNGAVRLVGTVPSDTQKATAEQLARDVAGVREVDASGLNTSESTLAETEDEDE